MFVHSMRCRCIVPQCASQGRGRFESLCCSVRESSPNTWRVEVGLVRVNHDCTHPNYQRYVLIMKSMVSSNDEALVSTRDNDAAADLLLYMLEPTVSAGLLYTC